MEKNIKIILLIALIFLLVLPPESFSFLQPVNAFSHTNSTTGKSFIVVNSLQAPVTNLTVIRPLEIQKLSSNPSTCNLKEAQIDNYIQNTFPIDLNQPAACFSLTENSLLVNHRQTQSIVVRPLVVDYSKTIVTVATLSAAPVVSLPPLNDKTGSVPIEPILALSLLFFAGIIINYKSSRVAKGIQQSKNFLPQKIILLC